MIPQAALTVTDTVPTFCGHLDRGTIGQQWIADPGAPGDFLPLLFSAGDFPGFIVRRTDFDGTALAIPYYRLH